MTADAVRQEGAQSVEFAPGEAGIEKERIQAEQDKSFQAREQPSALANEPQPLVGERLGEPLETAPHKGEIERRKFKSVVSSQSALFREARAATFVRAQRNFLHLRIAS